MPNWKKLAGQAKSVLDQRGGTDALKRDFEKVKDAASGPGTAKEKAQRAAEAAKASELAGGKPGAGGAAAGGATPGDPAVKPKVDPDAPRPGAATGTTATPDPDAPRGQGAPVPPSPHDGI